jgi:hypothetical protein
MAGNSQPNEVVTRNYIRAFTQRGGPGPSIPLLYAGAQEQYLMVGDISRPDRGGISAINVNDPRRRGLFRRSGITIDAPDIPSNTVTFRQYFNGVPWYDFKLDCPVNIYEAVGLCGDPSDPINGWITVKILSQGLSTDRSSAGRTPFDESDVTTTDVGFSWTGDVYDIGGIVVGEQGAADVTTEVVDIVYGGYQNCANCGTPNDGTKWIYALQQTAGGSSSVNGKVLYNTTYGAGSWTALAITGLAPGSLVDAIDIVGNYLVVVSSTDNAYYISSINQLTGVPSSTWTKVSTGFVALKQPKDLFVESPSRIYFVGNGGYVYVSTNIAAGVSVLNAGATTTANLARIHGDSGVLLSVGASGAVIKSLNKGNTWVLTTTQLSGTLQAAAVRSAYSLWAGNSAGVASYSDDQGETWSTLSTLTGSAAAGIFDVVWASAEVGYICATRTGPTAVLFATFDGGRTWCEAPSSRLPAAPTYGRPNRLAFPPSPDIMIASNNVAIAGLSGGLTDGIVLVGSAPVL